MYKSPRLSILQDTGGEVRNSAHFELEKDIHDILPE
jgi:hypothetical protein